MAISKTAETWCRQGNKTRKNETCWTQNQVSGQEPLRGQDKGKGYSPNAPSGFHAGCGWGGAGPRVEALCSREKRPGVPAASRAQHSRPAPGETSGTGQGRQQPRRPRPVEPQRHQAATRRTAAQGRGNRSRTPSPTGSGGGSGARSRPAKLSLQARRQEPADGHQLSRRTTQPWAGQEPAALEDARGAAFAIPDPPSPPATCSKL